MKAIFDKLMSKRTILTAACLLILCVAGCTSAAGPSAIPFGIEMPRVTAFSYKWANVTDSSAGMNAQIKIYNPNPVSVGVSRLTAKAYIDGINIADIAQQEDATIAAQQETGVNLAVLAHTDQAGTCIAQHISQGEASTLSIRGTVNIGSGWLSVPYPLILDRNFNTHIFDYLDIVQDMKLPQGVNIVRINSSWGTIADDKIQVFNDIEVLNQSQNTIDLSTQSYRILANGIEMIDGSPDSPIVLKPGSNEIRLTSVIYTSAIPELLASYVKNGETTTLHGEFMPSGATRDFVLGRIPVEYIVNGGKIDTDTLKQMLPPE